tara:strand:+ start:48 stop:182 length:135 start_codon:yes stop_codon:yes gene_type:complete
LEPVEQQALKVLQALPAQQAHKVLPVKKVKQAQQVLVVLLEIKV